MASLTTEPVATSADIEAVVDMYRTRWLIEECNKALKTGCRSGSPARESGGTAQPARDDVAYRL